MQELIDTNVKRPVKRQRQNVSSLFKTNFITTYIYYDRAYISKTNVITPNNYLNVDRAYQKKTFRLLTFIKLELNNFTDY